MIKSNFLTSIFQEYLKKRDIRKFKNNYFYYALFRLIRNFLAYDLILNIYNFKVYGSIKKNKTSYFLLKKCEFGDYHELSIIKKLSDKNNLLFIDCGCNYGFYSFYTASLSKNNNVISIEASRDTSKEFIKNLRLNNFKNIHFLNKSVSNSDDENISFYESVNDWESSQAHNNFKFESELKVKSVKIDSLLKDYSLDKHALVIKLDVEGNEINVIKGALDVIQRFDPLIIIEFSKYIFENKDNIDYLKYFLNKYNFTIYDTNYKKKKLEDILEMLKNLKKRYKTIGNFYLCKNSSKNLEIFLSNE